MTLGWVVINGRRRHDGQQEELTLVPTVGSSYSKFTVKRFVAFLSSPWKLEQRPMGI